SMVSSVIARANTAPAIKNAATTGTAAAPSTIESTPLISPLLTPSASGASRRPRPFRSPSQATATGPARAASEPSVLRARSPPRPSASREVVTGEQRRFERDAVVGEPLGAVRSDAGRLQLAEELPVLVHPHAVVEQVQVLEHDDVALH